VKFICPQCSARYAVPEERLPEAKVLRFTCKRCGHVIRFRTKESERRVGAPVVFENVPDFSQPNAQPTRVAPNEQLAALLRASSGVGSRDGKGLIASASEKPNSLEATHVASMDEVHATLEASAEAGRENRRRWYYLIRGERLGPVNINTLGKLLATGQVSGRTYVWCKGMKDWQRASENPGLWAQLNAMVGPESAHDPSASEDVIAVPAPEAEIVTARRTEQLHGRDFAAEAGAASDPAESVGGFAFDGPPGASATLELGAVHGLFPQAVEEPAVSSSEELVMLETRRDESAVPPSTPEDGPSLDAYLQAPPGDSTRSYIATAGLYRRKRNQRIAIYVAASAACALGVVLTLDGFGKIRLPGMGLLYDVTGLADPNSARAVSRVEDKLATGKLTAAERARLETLREQLLGATGSRKTHRASSTSGPIVPGLTNAPAGQAVSGVAGLNPKERDLAVDVFGDKRKSETDIKLSDPANLEVPNLPAGLTQAAVFEVISANSRAMSLCLAESVRKGEKLTGKMEIELTIEATGRVTEANISSSALRSTVMAACVLRRVKGWRFPRFAGEPVTVVYPYILQTVF
jgi:predicted Zn finger-like uncharacterized protein